LKFIQLANHFVGVTSPLLNEKRFFEKLNKVEMARVVNDTFSG